MNRVTAVPEQRVGPCCPFRSLDLSDNALGEKGVRACAPALTSQARMPPHTLDGSLSSTKISFEKFYKHRQGNTSVLLGGSVTAGCGGRCYQGTQHPACWAGKQAKKSPGAACSAASPIGAACRRGFA